MKPINDVERKRVNMNIPVHILDRLDSLAGEVGINRTSMLTVILKQYIDQQDALGMVDQLKKLEQRLDSENVKEGK